MASSPYFLLGFWAWGNGKKAGRALRVGEWLSSDLLQMETQIQIQIPDFF